MCNPNSAAYIKSDGSPVSCHKDWLACHDRYADRVQYEQQRDTITKALKLVMGSEFKQTFKPQQRPDGLYYNPLDSLLPHQIWDKCQKRLEKQHFDGGSNLKNDLHALKFEIGDDMTNFLQENFLNLANRICYEDPDDLNDSESTDLHPAGQHQGLAQA